jgi:hypothetical protein
MKEYITIVAALTCLHVSNPNQNIQTTLLYAKKIQSLRYGSSTIVVIQEQCGKHAKRDVFSSDNSDVKYLWEEDPGWSESSRETASQRDYTSGVQK